MKKDHIQSEIRAVEDFEEYNAKKVPASGARPDNKLDIYFTEGIFKYFRISNKHTVKNSFSVNLEDFDKDKNDARFMGCNVFRRVEVENPITGKLRKFIVIEQDDFKNLLIND